MGYKLPFQVLFVLVGTVFVSQLVSTHETTTEGYTEQKPAKWSFKDMDKWCKSYEKCCNGTSQSPINIETKKAGNSSYAPLSFSAGYFDQTLGRIYNTEHYAGFYEPRYGGAALTISGGPMGDSIYQFRNLNFHYGSSKKSGYIHTLDGKKYPGELHMVHYNTKYSPEEAMDKDDGLVTFAFPLEQEKKVKKKFPSFEPLLESMDRIKKKGRVEEIEIALGDFFLAADGVSDYYSYQGSLIHPPCSESVTWLIFKPIELKKEQFKALRKLKDEEGHKLWNNYRPLQRLNGREVSHVKN